MNKKVKTILIAMIALTSLVFAQDPPASQGASNQGPIGSMICKIIGGGALAIKKYIKSKTK